MAIPFGEMSERQRSVLAKANAALEKYVAEYGDIQPIAHEWQTEEKAA